MISVNEVSTKEELDKVFAIREEVFVEEQQVSREEEYDEFEESSRHYLATEEGVPCGVARWRRTANGIKLERFAVLKPYRNGKVGTAVLKKVLADVKAFDPAALVYLHAQLPAITFYEREGFQKAGDLFMECDIAHYKMILNRD